jgi:hypothetical protein
MTCHRLLILCLLVAAPVALEAQVQQTGRPHTRIPADSAAILAARSTFRWVEAALKAGQLARQDTTVECEHSAGEQTISLYRDSARVVRRLTWEGGSEHQSVRTSYYYDDVARLRFAFFEQSAENGTLFEERVYYGDGARVVRRLRKLVRGPGWGSHPVQAAPDPMEYVRRFCED